MSDDAKAMAVCAILVLVLAPLGTWKLVEIIVWLCEHVQITLRHAA